MTSPQPERRFEPIVLRWAREKMGMTVEVAATRLERFVPDITAALIRDWEVGHALPTPAHVKRLAEIYKRPLAVFLLASPPDENTLPPDRRTMGSRAGEAFGADTLLVIR